MRSRQPPRQVGLLAWREKRRSCIVPKGHRIDRHFGRDKLADNRARESGAYGSPYCKTELGAGSMPWTDSKCSRKPVNPKMVEFGSGRRIIRVQGGEVVDDVSTMMIPAAIVPSTQTARKARIRVCGEGCQQYPCLARGKGGPWVQRPRERARESVVRIRCPEVSRARAAQSNLGVASRGVETFSSARIHSSAPPPSVR